MSCPFNFLVHLYVEVIFSMRKSLSRVNFFESKGPGVESLPRRCHYCTSLACEPVAIVFFLFFFKFWGGGGWQFVPFFSSFQNWKIISYYCDIVDASKPEYSNTCCYGNAFFFIVICFCFVERWLMRRGC